MDLKTFVSQTLAQIVEGVIEAQGAVQDSGAAVSPKMNPGIAEASKQGFLFAFGDYVQIVQFDVALTAAEGTGTKGGIGIIAGAVTLGSSGQSTASNSSVSHVRFSVPMRLPTSN